MAGIKAKSSGVKPYQPKSKADETYRKQMYSDSSALATATKDTKVLVPFNKADKAGFAKSYQPYLGPKPKEAGKASTLRENYAESNVPMLSTKIQPIGAGAGSTLNMHDNNSIKYQAPKQEILPFEDNSKIKPRGIKVKGTTDSLPSKLNTVATTPMAKSTLTTDRAVTKVKYTPSDKPGYEKMRDYGTYSKTGDEVTAPRGTTPTSKVATPIKVAKKAAPVEDTALNDEKVPLAKLEAGSKTYAKGAKGIKVKANK